MRQTPPPGLRPNCLLTRFPICFVHGLKNIFCAYDYWNGVPEYLRDHGYEVHVFKGPWRGPHEKRLKSFSDQFHEVLKKHRKVHVIAHSLGTLDMLDLLGQFDFKGRFASCTFISPPFGGTPFAELGLLFGKSLFKSTNETLTKQGASEIVKRFKKPEDVLVGSILSRPKNHPITGRISTQHRFLKKFLERRQLNGENDGLVPYESQRIAESLGKIFFEFPGDHVQVIGAAPWPSIEKTAHSRLLDHAIFLAEYDFQTAQ